MTRILVVEDEEGIALGLEDTLRLEGYAVELVGNGARAAERAREQLFDLIVLDVTLPGKNGFDVCQELRRTDARTPVILLTARSLEEDRVRGLDAGANDYVTKPFSSRELLARIRALLRYVSSSRRNEDWLEGEFRKAREVQEGLFPRNRPHVPGIDCYCECRPAARVSGDYYDFLSLPCGAFAFLVADVSGKGMPAALLGASLQAMTRSAAVAGLGCAEVLARANQAMFDADTCHRYATVFVAAYDVASRRLTYANAGHYPPFILRGDSLIRLDALTPPVGMFPELPAAERVIELRAGDRILVTSDGVPEATNAAGEDFGDDRLRALLDEHRSAEAAELCRLVIEAALTFADGAQSDDMTVLAARVLTKS